MKEIVCVPVKFSDGEIVYVPAQEFYTNPPEGAFRVKYKKQLPEPVRCEVQAENWIRQPDPPQKKKKTHTTASEARYGTQNIEFMIFDEMPLWEDPRRKK